MLYCNSKHSKERDTQLGRWEGKIEILTRTNYNIRQTYKLLTNKIDNLRSILENQSLMTKRYFGKEEGIDKNSNLNTSNNKELMDLTEKKVVKKLTLNHLMDNAMKGSEFMNIFG